VAGEAGVDPTEPPRSGPYPARPAPLAPVSERIAAAAERLGLRPFRLPLALNRIEGERSLCRECITCDGYACRIGAKNDLATTVLPALIATGRLEIRAGATVTRLTERGGRLRSVEGFDESGAFEVEADTVVLAAGALGSPGILLASGLEALHGPGHVIGLYLMRHCNAFVYGYFADRPNETDIHHKQLAFNDFYFGDRAAGAPAGKLGNIQQVMHPQLGGLFGIVPRLVGGLSALGPRAESWVLDRAMGVARHVTGLQVIAEDQPRASNRVTIDRSAADAGGLPPIRISHGYTRRDLRARRALVRRAREILREAGAFRWTYPHLVGTYSHAVGTVRMGTDPGSSALDARCAFRGLDNLYVLDGSFMPTSGGVNPSLTIAANALRVGRLIGER
jgi:choline dehydrogenase-like flavoprotein